jgi:hypothetical protein
MATALEKTLNKPLTEPLSAGAKYEAAVSQPIENIGKLQQEIGEFEATKAEDLATREAGRTKAKAASTRAMREEIVKAPEREQQRTVDEQLMNAAFVPTQDNAKDLAGLFSLINVIGFAIGRGGKNNAMQAMSAMNGMAEGYQKGRADLYKKEKDQFDTSMKTLKTKSDILSKRLKEISELAAVNKQAADEEADVLFAEQGADFLKKYKDKYGLGALVEFWKQVAQAKGKATEMTITEEQKKAELAAKDRANRLAEQRLNLERERQQQGTYTYVTKDGKTYAINTKNPADIREVPIDLSDSLKVGTQPKTSGGGGAAAGQIERMANAMTQVTGSIKSIADLPITTTAPVFGQKDFKGLFSAPLSVLNQKISNETAQMMAGRVIGVARNLASLETGGAATGLAGLTDSIQAGISIPAGAKLHVALDRLAEMRRIVEDSSRAALASPKYNESQKRLIEENLEIVKQAIPFTLEDVRDATVAGSGKSPKVAKEDQNLSFTDYINKYGVGSSKEKGESKSSLSEEEKAELEELRAKHGRKK